MGPKITVDSSTLMNKGLEVIEAHELFGAPAGEHGVGIGFDQIEVVVHPQSIVHSMVTYTDGVHHRPAVDTRHAPADRVCAGLARSPRPRPSVAIDWAELGRLDFEPPDLEAFPCLGLAYDGRAGRGRRRPAWLNAANEVAVEAFLDGRIRWIDIPDVLEAVLDRHDGAASRQTLPPSSTPTDAGPSRPPASSPPVRPAERTTGPR